MTLGIREKFLAWKKTNGENLLTVRPPQSYSLNGIKYFQPQLNIDKKISCNVGENGNKLWNISLKRGENFASAKNCHIQQIKVPPTLYLPPDYIKDGEMSALTIGTLESTGGGLGTKAIKEAVKLSKRIGQGGRLTLAAFQINSQKGNPIPFYNKLGFKSMDPKEQLEIERGMKDFYNKGEYTGPKVALMYLPMDKVNEILSQISYYA